MEMPQTPSFGSLLKRFRKAAKLSQLELAGNSGISTHTISDLERGFHQTPRKETIDLLASALGLKEPEIAQLQAAARESRWPDFQQLADMYSSEGLDPSLLATDQHASQQRQHNLRIASTPLVDREVEVAQLIAWLRREDVRLVTLTGPGGVGKTRLALSVAAQLLEHYRDGVWLVRLERLLDPGLVLPTIADTLRLRESGEQAIEQVLREYLRTRQMLLVLDNFERVVQAATKVAELLGNSPGLKVLVTSSMSLRLLSEHEIRVPPFAVVDPRSLPPLAEITQNPAVALFIQRARMVKSDFQVTPDNALAVVEICARLDGLPLAIELAASRVRVLSPEALLSRLSQTLNLLTRGARDADERQQTMRAAIAWSTNLLTPAERVLFRRLSVFVGGCTVEAAEAVCAALSGAAPLKIEVFDGLSTLVEQSLVQPRTEKKADEPRFGMLQVIREYALERLEKSAEAEALHRAHATYLLTIFEPDYYLQVIRQQGTEWMMDVEREYDNVRAALDWACAHGEVELGLRLGASVAGFWVFRGHLREGRRWLETLVALGVGSRLGEERVRGAEAVAEVKQRAGPAAARAWVNALEYAGLLAGDREDKVSLHAESVVAARALGDMIAVAAGLHFLGLGVLTLGDIPRGLALLEEGLNLARTLTDKPELLAAELTQYGSALLLVPGEEERAVSMMEESLDLAQQMDSPGYGAVPRLVLTRISRHRGDLTRASTLMFEALRLIRDYGLTLYVPEFLDEFALIAEGQGRVKRAAQLLGAAARTIEMFDTAGLQPDPIVNADVEAMVARGRAALGKEAWGKAFEEGRALTLEGAIAEALDQTGVEITSRLAPTDE